jgi:hypothetical protein
VRVAEVHAAGLSNDLDAQVPTVSMPILRRLVPGE